MADLILGQVLRFTANPFIEGIAAAQHDSLGAVLIEDGRIRATGPAAEIRAAHPQAQVHDYGRALISAGFIDAHVHFPQTAIIASWGKRLIDWLNTYTFPEEMRFADPAYAAEIARRYFDLTLANGTTTTCSFATIHPASVDAYFTKARAHGLRALTGKTCMDRNMPEVLIVPLVAFDARFYRLGYGGGFYDRTLEGLRIRGPVLAIGFAFTAQELSVVPIEPTDEPLDLIVTEQGILRPD